MAPGEKKHGVHAQKAGSLLCAFVWKDFQSAKPLENEKTFTTVEGRII